VGLKSLKSLNLTNGYPNKNKNKNNNNKVKSKPLELFELAGKKYDICCQSFTVATVVTVKSQDCQSRKIRLTHSNCGGDETFFAADHFNKSFVSATESTN
jgi:hypothetical protein